MQGSPAAAPGQGTVRSFLGSDPGLLMLLLLISAGIHAWLIGHTVVASRDGLDFLHFAWQLEHHPWAEVLPAADRHPGYAVAVLAMSLPVRHLLGGPSCDAMVLSAQLVSTLAGCLLVLPLYYLGRELFHRWAGFGAAVLFQCLPVSGRVLSDALSEPLFLLLAATALLLAVRGLRGPSALRFGLCGLCGGLAYLVRVEGALVVAAAGLILVGVQGVPAWRRPWGQALAGTAALAVAALAVAGPYVAVIGHVTANPTGKKALGMIGLDGPREDDSSDVVLSPPERSAVGSRTSPVGDVALAIPLAVWWLPDSGGAQGGRLGWSLGAVINETAKGFHYLALLLALAGLYWSRDHWRRQPGAWLLLLLCLLQALAVWRVAFRAGYAADRHVLLIVMCGLFWAAAALCEWPRRWRDWRRSRAGGEDVPAGPGVWSWVLLAALVATGLPKTLQPLHPYDRGYRLAGQWLAEHAGPTDLILDPSAWAWFYAGRAFQDDWAPPPAGSQPLIYVVLDPARNQHDKEIAIAQAVFWAKRGDKVFDWRPDHPGRNLVGEVEVYRVLPPAQ